MHALFARIKFLTGAHQLSQAPPDEGMEVAFAGRSNAGKSRAINAITRFNTLARVSKTPGRTQQINFFALDDIRRLVDLPGYGYAEVPEKVRRHWLHTLELYLQTRASLHGVILVMDIRHPLMPADTQMLDWCQVANMPVHILLTKADKLSRSQACSSWAKVNQDLTDRYGKVSDTELDSATVPVAQMFSSLTHVGLSQAQQRLGSWLQLGVEKE